MLRGTDLHLHTLPSDILIAILLYCDVRTIAALLRASAIFWRLPYVPHCFGAKRQVVIALDRIRSERIKSPWYYNTDKNNMGLEEWSDEEKAWNELCQLTLEVPCGLLRGFSTETFCIDFDTDDAWQDLKYIVYNQHDTTSGLYLLALHSNEVIFSKGFDYAMGKDGDPEDYEFWHPPRGRLPFGRKWNYALGGYL